MAPTESKVPKAVLYYSPTSVWSAVALLALEEKGYGADEVDLRIVDLASGENYDPTFLRLNPNATVPTLVVPLKNTISEDVESRYKAITDSKAIVEFLDKSRSAQSRTNTTSEAPAPTLTPATIAFLATSNEIIELLHSGAADPNKLWIFNARDQNGLRRLSGEVLPFLRGKDSALSRLIGDAEGERIHVSEKTKKFWRDKKEEIQTFLGVFLHSDKPDAELDGEARTKREAYYGAAQTAWEVDLKQTLEKLEEAMIGPYVLGDQLSIADVHLIGWLARIARIVGASASDGGETVGGRVRERSGGGGGRKLSAYWDAARGRSSWKKTYGGGVY